MTINMQQFTHREGCTGSDADLRGFTRRTGDPMRRCTVCRMAQAVRAPEPVHVEPITAGPAPWSGWRCREHLDRPVTPRGTGCPECADKPRRRRRDRRPADPEINWSSI